ncbi:MULTISPECIES: nitrite reductase small subunit NirD [Burkholderia]|uniref:Nitrite reductase small subunit NirD n=2 Tax=Burkholderia humptydooensis TaxID=430531 RepID=A0A7U4P9T4_9BURK|nr:MULTISPECIES: nitrite reductase small subunit NirD [Burkholderia]AGK50603.1 nitrite reductase [NAD(P)H], small subunit [Burkholderia thailandensis MSMB121]ATF32638.1 nitrite reductase (NAD(P)H) small subunit [Burkholderia thailandensis]AJY40281.1 nitrite reductase [NAD(P)H], small subunit [Burkholderia sp. 2002721687]ALX45615.1 nitrite reductase small subunit [Burkholderia humptydooensis]EIP86568.1 nitrite reductase [Burkholderia humptydooensis MSMB43]
MNNPRHASAWTPVCALDEIVPNTGVCALVNGEQIAVFHVDAGDGGRAFAIGNVDPHSHAAVLSRGLIGSLGERIVVASPLYKHHFDLRTGECVEAPDKSVSAYPSRVEDGYVWVAA